MNLTEFIVTGYDGDRAVFASNLTPTAIRTVFTVTGPDGETAVESSVDQAAATFTSLLQVLEDLYGAPATTAPESLNSDTATVAG